VLKAKIRKVLIMNNRVLVRVMSRKGATFAAVRDYTSVKSGEVSNQTIIAGYSYENAKKHDLAIVQGADAKSLAIAVNYPVDLVEKVLGELEASLTKPDAARSEGQTEAYTHLGSGIKRHNDTKQLYLTGLVVSKTVLKAGEFKEVKSADKTICKNKVKKALELRMDKIRQFVLDNGTFNLRGESINA